MTHHEKPATETTVAVVGLGLLGRGIVACFLGHGFRVVGFGRSQQSHERAREYIGRGLQEMVDYAGFDESILTDWKSRYQETDRYDNWGECDLVVESIAEDTAAKHEIYDQIERFVGSTVPIASNTSSIPISELQDGRGHPERFLGMHWFEPAHATRFLELVPGVETSSATMEAAVQIAKRCGKEPSVLNKDLPGFIVNRMGYALYREALNLLEMGVADAETIDRSFRNAIGVWSTVFGPFGWMDLTGGPKLYGACMERVLPTLSGRTELPNPIKQLTAEDALGVTNGHGFYEYTAEEARQADELFHKHAWKARALMNHYFPISEV